MAVSAMAILTSVMQFALLPLQGLGQGAQPIISYNFGANNAERVRKGFRFLLISAVVYAAGIWAVSELAPGVFVTILQMTRSWQSLQMGDAYLHGGSGTDGSADRLPADIYCIWKF